MSHSSYSDYRHSSSSSTHRPHNSDGLKNRRTGCHDFNSRSINLDTHLPIVHSDKVDKVPAVFKYYTATHHHTNEEIDAWQKQNSISIYGDRIPSPMLEFSELVAPDVIHEAFREAGYSNPTTIQSVAWPAVLQSRDLVGIARTGSGKTMAFMVPAILHILGQLPLRFGDGPIALVLAPTRELAVQIEEETRKVSKKVPNLRSVCIYGGAPKYEQKKALKTGVHICIATPGRLIDMLACSVTNLLRVTYLVLDEADRMLDMGFEPQIRQICSQIRTDRQTLMFSATWPQEIRGLASSFQRDFIRISIGSEDLLANPDVQQHFAILNQSEKEGKLLEIFRSIQKQRVLIFTKTKKMADNLHYKLQRANIPAMVIHGDKEQNHREYVLDTFRHDPHACLVATDVAARGLDIQNLDIVINYDFPTNIEDYVHRIGRTGRAGKKGDAFTFFTADEPNKSLRELCALLRRANQIVPQELLDLMQKGSGGGCSGGGRGYGRRGGNGYNNTGGWGEVYRGARGRNDVYGAQRGRSAAGPQGTDFYSAPPILPYPSQGQYWGVQQGRGGATGYPTVTTGYSECNSSNMPLRGTGYSLRGSRGRGGESTSASRGYLGGDSEGDVLPQGETFSPYG